MTNFFLQNFISLVFLEVFLNHFLQSTNPDGQWYHLCMMKNVVKSILRLYIKQSVIDNCSNSIAYKNIDLLNKSNIVSKKKKKKKKIIFGCVTELTIAELVKKL